MASIIFTDSAGTWQLNNGKPWPASRFSKWTPSSEPFGDSASRQSDRAITMMRFSDEFGVSFELPMIPSQRSHNLLQHSSAFDQAAWSKNNVTITADDTSVVAPDGSQMADKVVENTAASTTHGPSQLVTITANVDLAFALYVRAGTRTWVGLKLYDSGTNTDSVTKAFDLVNGVVGNTTTAGTGAVRGAYVVADARGFYRCVLVANIGNNRTSIRGELLMATGNGGYVYTGDGASYVHAWGGQIDQIDAALWLRSPRPYLHTGSAARSNVSQLEVADRLRYHLLNGGTCIVHTNDVLTSIYTTCGLLPGTKPQLKLSDERELEYTLSLQLLNVAGSPTRMMCHYADQ